MLKSKFQFPNSGIRLLFGCLCLVIGFSTNAYALGLDNLKAYFLNGDYKTCITEGEKILARASSSKDLDELYYILGLSYLKDGNYLRSSDIFEIILKEYRNSKFKEEAKLGLGDSYFARSDFKKAESLYQEMLKNNPRSKLKPGFYYRLSQLGKRTADFQQEQEYLHKLKSEFPQSPEALTNKEFLPGNSIIPVAINKTAPVLKTELNIPEPVNNGSGSVEVGSAGEIISGSYSVQVGAFSLQENARGLALKLKAQGFSSYISQAMSGNKKIYKVRVGGFASKPEAKAAARKLELHGYSTKIIP
jgi:tetratricopeptide (TPR) repeat protein